MLAVHSACSVYQVGLPAESYTNQTAKILFVGPCEILIPHPDSGGYHPYSKIIDED